MDSDAIRGGRNCSKYWLLLVVQAYVKSVHSAFLDDLVYGRIGFLQVYKSGYFKNREGGSLKFAFVEDSKLREKILRIAEVKAIMPRLSFVGALSVPQVDDSVLQTNLIIDAHDEADAKEVIPILSQSIIRGRMFNSRAANEMVFHWSVAEVYSFAYPSKKWANDMQPALLVPGSDGVIHSRLISPIGEFRDSFSNGHPVGVMSLKSAQDLLGMPNLITSYSLNLRNPESIDITRKLVQRELGDEFEVKSWVPPVAG